jgi:hypothetical protein
MESFAQDALPLPPRPSLEQYRKRAKALHKAARSRDPKAVPTWATAWLEKLFAHQPARERRPERIEREAEKVAEFARAKLKPQRGSLAGAQFVIARAHGFLSWPKLAAHIESLARSSSEIAAFESAVEAIIGGDEATLVRLLRARPGLARARSSREHNATLLHHVSANGVEGYRQKSPKNAARIAELLLEAGAEVDAVADVYGGGCTTLGLVATSMPPQIAGVQLPVIDVLLAHGARMDRPGIGGNDHALIRACLMNGQAEAARYLVSRGAPLDLAGAAGLGHTDVLERYFDHKGRLKGATRAQLLDAFSLACAYGSAESVRFLLERGLDVNVRMKGHGDNSTGLHVAAFWGRVEVVELLLARGADVHAIDDTWQTPPLSWALTGWSRKENEAERYYPVVAALIGTGAKAGPETLEWARARGDAKMLAALRAKP